ncbi:MAG: DUF1653 domain-containing protein [Candidatus Magasanikbacteria bacterium]|jgi:hypothetical protein
MANQKYRHYKGKIYEMVGVARHSETLEEMVVYRGLYDDEQFGHNPLWVRPKAEFFGTVMIDGKEILRFEPIK